MGQSGKNLQKQNLWAILEELNFDSKFRISKNQQSSLYDFAKSGLSQDSLFAIPTFLSNS